jgi:tRNA(Ile)-lysidine synthase
MDLLTAFQRNWAHKRFASIEQTVLLAVSGGQDSMVMADLFHKSSINFAIAHCNFQLRGEDSMLDEKLVLDWCKARNITCHNVRFDTKQKKEEWKKGTQETARILRYEWLDQICQQHGYSKLVTAHHANDNVETLMINLFKGTGISGLHAIPEQNGKIVRPLLFATKDELQQYGTQNNVPYREDVSNASDAYLRNAVRHHIIPMVDKWFPNAVQQVNESVTRFAQAEVLYKRQVEQERKKLMEQRGQDFYVPINKLTKHTPLETICYELFSPFGFSAAQVPHILELTQAETGHYISSSTHRIIRNRDFLIVTTIPADTADLILIEAAPCVIDAGRYQFSFTIEGKPKELKQDNYIAYIDLTQLNFPLILRKWRIGDYFYPLGMGMKKKKVSRYLIDQKVALHDKEHVWVLECQKRIVWLTGMRLDERFKVKDTTEKVLRVQLKQK